MKNGKSDNWIKIICFSPFFQVRQFSRPHQLYIAKCIAIYEVSDHNPLMSFTGKCLKIGLDCNRFCIGKSFQGTEFIHCAAESFIVLIEIYIAPNFNAVYCMALRSIRLQTRRDKFDFEIQHCSALNGLLLAMAFKLFELQKYMIELASVCQLPLKHCY